MLQALSGMNMAARQVTVPLALAKISRGFQVYITLVAYAYRRLTRHVGWATREQLGSLGVQPAPTKDFRAVAKSVQLIQNAVLQFYV